MQTIISKTVIIELTPNDVAEAVKGMSSQEQADLFNRLATVDWWPIQLQFVTQERLLTDEARAFMALVGEYAQRRDK